jgi:hypothetical protein
MNRNLPIRAPGLAALVLAVAAFLFLHHGESVARTDLAAGPADRIAAGDAASDAGILLLADNREGYGDRRGDDSSDRRPPAVSRGTSDRGYRNQGRRTSRRDHGWGHVNGQARDRRAGPSRGSSRSREGVRHDRRQGRGDNAVSQDRRRGGVRQDGDRRVTRGGTATRGGVRQQPVRGDIVRQRQRPVTRGQVDRHDGSREDGRRDDR